MTRQSTAALACLAGAAIAVPGIAVATAAAPHAAASRQAVAAPARAELTEFDCHPALDPPDRSIAVHAVMRPLAGTRSMAVRFDLLESVPGATITRSVVRGRGLGVWLSPRTPTLGQLPGDVWQLDKTVYDLQAPARYRYRVTFRWSAARGRVIGSAVQQSPICRQRELRPDLLVESITVTPVAQRPDRDQYAAVIADDGATGAGPFEVLFTPGDNSAAVTRTVGWLGAHRSATETFAGPICDPAAPPTVTVDATNEVDDLNRANNQLTAVCPAITTTSATTTISAVTTTTSSATATSAATATTTTATTTP